MELEAGEWLCAAVVVVVVAVVDYSGIARGDLAPANITC